MSKSKVPSVDISGFDWSRGQFREPDMSKMPAMKPMASHPQPSRQTSKPIAPIAPRSTRGKR